MDLGPWVDGGSTPGAAPAMCGSSPAEELAGGAQKVVAQALVAGMVQRVSPQDGTATRG